MADKIKEVFDINGVSYRIKRELGRGAQGKVFEVEGGKMAVKILSDRSPARREALKNQLISVKRLPLQTLSIAKPVEMLRAPHLGYVMALMTDMVPIKNLMMLPKDTPSSLDWYLEGGGLKRRLRLLSRAAELLSELHGKGLAFSDPSPNNIFVSENPNYHEVYFIDADNIRYQSSPVSVNLYTPGYGAPELVRGISGVNTLTDTHAFAVLAFQTLSITHPLVGDMVNNGAPELEEQALEGRLPWIEDPADPSNRSSNGLPGKVVLSPKLRQLFEQAFGSGLNDPLERPGMAKWAERLYTAANAVITCPDCKWSYYSNEKECPKCDHPRPPYVRALFTRWDADYCCITGKKGKPVTLDSARFTEDEPLIITDRLSKGETGRSGNTPCAKISFKKQSLYIQSLESLDNITCYLSSPSGSKRLDISSEVRKIPVNRTSKGVSWLLHFGSDKKSHRVAVFHLF